MRDSFDSQSIDGGIQELTMDEVNSVSGAMKNAGAAAGVMATIGAVTFGSGWGAVGVGAAFAAAPVAVIAMVGLGAYAGYLLLNEK
jgi:hypothetical protein